MHSHHQITVICGILNARGLRDEATRFFAYAKRQLPQQRRLARIGAARQTGNACALKKGFYQTGYFICALAEELRAGYFCGVGIQVGTRCYFNRYHLHSRALRLIVPRAIGQVSV